MCICAADLITNELNVHVFFFVGFNFFVVGARVHSVCTVHGEKPIATYRNSMFLPKKQTGFCHGPAHSVFRVGQIRPPAHTSLSVSAIMHDGACVPNIC